MAGVRDIKNRIKSVNSTKQITRAMNLVATAKLKRARARVEGVRPYFSVLQAVVKDIIEASEGVQNEFFNAREVKNTLYVVITADRGLCGGYNTNAIKKALSVEGGGAAVYITIGSKAKEYFTKRGYNVAESYVHVSESANLKDAQDISQRIIEMYKTGQVDEVYIIYNKFVSTIQFNPTEVKLLPLKVEDIVSGEGDRKAHRTQPIYEPSPEKVLEVLIPKYITGTIYGALLEASTSEESSRMTAMSSATDNATEMINDLTLSFNRARQASITREISEIVGGAEALT